MSVVNITGGKLAGITKFELDGSNDLVHNVLKGQVRTATGTIKGAGVDYPSSYEFGEVQELRYNCNFTASQFQGMFMRVAMASGVANTNTLRGMEIDARNASDQNVGELVGIHSTINLLGTGTLAQAYGLHAQISMRSDVAGVITKGAVIRAKFQTEDAGTVTAGYGILIENEFITGGLILDAAVRVEATGAAIGFNAGIDLRGTGLVEVGTNQVQLIQFKDSGGDEVALVVNDSGAVAVINAV